MEPHVDPSFDSRLAALRARLKQARDERGGCPVWEDLRADLLPGGRNREGRAARLAHRVVCPYCESHVTEWKRSVDHAADTLEAVEKGFVRGIAGGARGLVMKFARGGGATAPRVEAPVRNEANPREDVAPTRTRTRPAESFPVPARLLVIEMTEERRPPESVFLCAAALEAEVAVVPTLEEIAGDPDLALVCAIVLAGARPPADWPAAVRAARLLAPGRPVVLLAPYGVEASKGARRALGESLLSEDVAAELLLMALDPTLR